MTHYGYFDEHNLEYVITNPKTPVRWINYVGGLAFGGFIDAVGGSLICRGDPALNRITKYLPQLPASSFNGESLYLRLRQADGFKVFSPYFVPTLDRYERYECHVGLGYTCIVSEFYGIRTEATIFVPSGEAVLVRLIRITNLTSQPVTLDAVPVVEYTHPDSLKQFTNADWVPQTMVSDAVQQADGQVVLVQYPFMLRDTQINYFTSNLPVSSYETDRALFLGDHDYGTWAHPLSLDQNELNNSQARRGDNIGALLHPLGTLQPGETKELVTLLGQAASLQAAQPVIDRYRQPEQVEAALRHLADFWKQYLSHLQVNTPDPATNQMLNVHNPRQCYITHNWSRYLSLYQLGLGSRGIGFRDSSQDVMGILSNAPEEGRALLRMLLHVQNRNGSAMHQLNPLTMVASAGDALESEDGPFYYSDDHLWAVLAVCAYLKETGKMDFLNEVIPYYEKDRQGQPLESGTVLEHLQRGLEFTWNDTGAHGLPLLGYADWNDTVNLRKGAESLFTAHLFGRALSEMIALMRLLGDEVAATHYASYYASMAERVNECAWDGDWYVRYFDSDGSPLGSHHNAQGQIYANGQSWAVLSGFATPERARQAMDSLYTHLNTRYGIKLSAPGFNGYDPLKGGITTYPPGAKENGGIFLHANPWAMIAETSLGNGDRAYQYYRQINPAAHNDEIDIYQCEPYVYPQNILGDEHPQFGLARNSWLTGTSSWAYQAGTQYILGVRPKFEGLKVDPCIPTAWDGFEMRRVWRGAVYNIHLHNPQHISHGVERAEIDGQPLPLNECGECLLPALGDGQTHEVHIWLG